MSEFATLLLAASLAAAVATWCLTGGMRRYALAADMLDRPNARSSHSVPTPRGGGVAIVVSFALMVVALHLAGLLPDRLVLGLLPPTLLVALVGYIDDRTPLKARWRFIVHAAAAVWMLWVMRGIPPVPLFGYDVDLGWFGLALTIVYAVWMMSLYNFMDGIDGIAGIEAITVAVGGALCWWLAAPSGAWFVPLLLAAGVSGFLPWNLPPAKIFMGDVGSGFLGCVLAFFSLWAGHDAPRLFWCWYILLGCFMVDATTTLVRRSRRHEKVSEAHRSHAYQYASRKHGSHRRVTLAVGAINLAWLLPIALLVASGKVDGLAATIVAYLPLVGLAFFYKAGVRAAQEV